MDKSIASRSTTKSLQTCVFDNTNTTTRRSTTQPLAPLEPHSVAPQGAQTYVICNTNTTFGTLGGWKTSSTNPTPEKTPGSRFADLGTKCFTLASRVRTKLFASCCESPKHCQLKRDLWSVQLVITRCTHTCIFQWKHNN